MSDPVRVSLMMAPETLASVEDAARLTGRSPADTVAQAIRFWALAQLCKAHGGATDLPRPVYLRSGSGHTSPWWTAPTEDAPMAMTETFAATAAQTIPVFALAGVIEARAAIRTGWPNVAPVPNSKLATLRLWLRTIFKLGTIAAWFVMGGLNLIAEWECLSFLRDGHSAGWVDGFVFQTMVLSLLFLVIFPLYAIADRAGDKILEFTMKLDQSRASPEAADARSSDTEQGS